MDYATFIKQAERGEAPALALLHGGDVQLLDDALDAATRGLFPDRAMAAWGREVFDARESNADEIVRSASTLPLGVDRRLVAVRRAQALAAKGAEMLGGYAKSPNPASCLLLLADEPLRASRDRRTDHWLLGALPAAAIVELPTRGARDLAGWIRQRAALEGLTISDEAARLLVELTGEDTATLLGEARKAALAGGPDNRNVGVKDVGAIVGVATLLVAGTIGLAQADKIALLAIHWPTSATTQVFRNMAVDRAIEITEFADDYRELDWQPISIPK